ncbi:MAG: hypothetical protein PUJ51_12170 [Clostridiales bacterium]|uniref:hypothetical protein n=1 Tax=Terrisporobacter sp. TaxID=1965305 RepID=UPI002A4F086D|nr:hypothetical protein [Terrisporobacter sp.]MDD7755241.1 hypothetical protein [Clostridiales bacterium]MDY4135779.1 hypothetical protein [Terrisporobacter sp.]
MSHFTVAVFTEPNGKTVDELLAPYDENIVVEPYIDKTKEEIIQSAKETKDRILTRLKENPNYELDSWEEDYINAKTDEELYNQGIWEDEEYDENGNHLTNYNPKSKWDWYQIGGRWRGLLKAKKGEIGERSFFDINGGYNSNEYDSALVSDLHFDIDQEEYDKYIRFWEIVVEDSPLKEGEEKPVNWYKKEYYLDTYKNKEIFAKCRTSFSTFAVVLPNGEWCEKGKMGWFGVSSETSDEELDWDLHYKERFIDTAKPDWTITIVDCHI